MQFNYMHECFERVFCELKWRKEVRVCHFREEVSWVGVCSSLLLAVARCPAGETCLASIVQCFSSGNWEQELLGPFQFGEECGELGVKCLGPAWR